MSNCSPNNLIEFIQSIPEFKMRDAEKTLFSIGGRGYYENVTSDLLAFFMSPDEDHGLGDIFLSSYFDTMKTEEKPDFSGVRIQRETPTIEGKRIDLQIVGANWCLLIENKIWHIQNNPFDLYENHALVNFPSLQKFYSILSPDGESKAARWNGVSYRDYCQHLEIALGNCQTTSDPKWLLFAREFVLHLKNEVYTKAMNPEQIEFIEKHLHEVDEVLKLKNCYRQFVAEQFIEEVGQNISAQEIRVKDEGWAIRCFFDSIRGWSIALWWEHDTKFMISTYMYGLSQEQSPKADEFFEGWVNFEEGCWHNLKPGFESRMIAMKEISRVAEFMRDLHVPEQMPIP